MSYQLRQVVGTCSYSVTVRLVIGWDSQHFICCCLGLLFTSAREDKSAWCSCADVFLVAFMGAGPSHLTLTGVLVSEYLAVSLNP